MLLINHYMKIVIKISFLAKSIFELNQNQNPPSYVCEMRDYSSADAKNIQIAVPNFDWEKTFENF